MLIIRPIQKTDLDQLFALSALASAGLTSLPSDREVLQRKIKQSQKSFQDLPDKPEGEVYLFVAEDRDTKKSSGLPPFMPRWEGLNLFIRIK